MTVITRFRTPLAAALAAACMTAGTAYAVEVTKTDENTTNLAVKTGEGAVTVGPRFVLGPGDESPVDFPGVRGDRKGGPIAKGAAVVGYRITATVGPESMIGVFQMVCPDRKRFVTFDGSGGPIHSKAIGPSPDRPRLGKGDEYIGKRSWAWTIGPFLRGQRGQTLESVVYGYCR